jgi:hypothetical protein
MTADAELDALPLEQLDDLWDFDDPAASEERFRSLLPRARAEARGAVLGELLSQLARAQGLQRRFDDAEATLREAGAARRGRRRRRNFSVRARPRRMARRRAHGTRAHRPVVDRPLSPLTR